jgi:parallel beta-helix repeat protein
MKKTISLVLVLILVLVIGEFAQAATITIGPGRDYDFDTIQAGIDAAVDGDTVQVAPGEYVITEPITFIGKAITVKSEAGPDQTTIRMGTPTNAERGSVVVFENNETESSVLDGFTITGGTGCLRTNPNPSGNNWSGHVGGGILCWEASPTIVACTITQNRADHAGGLVYVQSAASLIDCIICGNSVEVDVGGVVCWTTSSVILTNCTISDNMAGNDVGGVACAYGSSLTTTNCTISDNTAGNDVGGVSCAYDSSVTMINCTVADNTVENDVGGVSCFNGSSVTMTNCNITNNTAANSVGGVSSYLGGSSVTMTDCIVSANTAVKGLGGGICCALDNASVTMIGCTIAANTSGEWSGGGVACLHNASVSASHCTLTGNTAQLGGGGMLIYDQSSATVSNCTIAQNRAMTIGGGGIWCGQSSVSTVTNSIIRGNTAPRGNEISVRKWTTGNTASTLTISYSNVGGGKAEVNVESGCTLDWGVGNIDADPYFVDPTNDDFHLKSQAGRWDSESQTWIQDDVTSPCIDAGDPMSPIGWEPFPTGGFVNIGAYSGTSKASKSYFGEPICETIVAGDINGDGKVNRADLDIMALHWTDDEPISFP